MSYKTLTVSRESINNDVRQIFRHWTDGSKHLISHYLSPVEFRKQASFTGNDHELVEWVENFPHKVGAIYVVSDHDLIQDMEKLRPSLVFYQLEVKDELTPGSKQGNITQSIDD